MTKTKPLIFYCPVSQNGNRELRSSLKMSSAHLLQKTITE